MNNKALDPPLTGIHDTDQEILLHLDDSSLFTFCSVSKSAQKLCNETFWWRKFVKEFGTDLKESKKNGIEINYKKIYKQLRNLTDTELFFESAKYGYIDLVKRLIELKRVKINETNDFAIRWASVKGHWDVVKYLIEHGADIHADYDFALRWTSEKGNLDLVKYLIEHGADIHANNDYALLWASERGHWDVVKYLIEHGADIHANNDYALRWASSYGHLNLVKYLIEHKANIHARDDLALQWASKYGNLDVVTYLTAHGADITVLRNLILPDNISNYLKSITDNNNENDSESLQCEGITKKGTRCKKNKCKGSKYCSIHK